MRISIDYDVSIRCRLGRHDQSDAEHRCQGGFTPLLGAHGARFCLCQCHGGSAKPRKTLRKVKP